MRAWFVELGKNSENAIGVMDVLSNTITADSFSGVGPVGTIVETRRNGVPTVALLGKSTFLITYAGLVTKGLSARLSGPNCKATDV